MLARGHESAALEGSPLSVTYPLRRALLRPLWFVLAILFLIEAWCWERLQPLFAWVAGLLPWRELKERCAAAVRHLPPWAALLLFAVPLALVEPMKLVALWFFAQGRIGTGVVTFAVAQVLALGLSAFLFDLVKDKLLTMAWFARLYSWTIRLHALAHAQVEPVIDEIRALRDRLGLGRGEVLARVRRRIAALRRRAGRSARPSTPA